MISNTSRIENKVTVAENLGLDGRQKITVLGIKFLMKFDWLMMWFSTTQPEFKV